MGNCCRTASSMEWAGDDWGSFTSKHKRSSSKVFDEGGHHHDELIPREGEKMQLLGALRASRDIDGKVKIKIPKKELEALLEGIEKQKQEEKKKKKQEGGGVSAEQVLFRLLYARDHNHAHHSPWRPVLQSIPEVN